VGAESATTSTARSLSARYPSLRFLVQVRAQARYNDPARTTALAQAQAQALAPAFASQPILSMSSAAEGLHGSITYTTRLPGSVQTAADAAVYIMHLPYTEAATPSRAIASAILAELHAHLPVLRSSGGVMLILTPRLLPEPGSLPNPEVEAMARARDLTLLQLANAREMELTELLQLIERVQDGVGRLSVTKKLRRRNNLVAALLVNYQDHHHASGYL
jgi:hypothetical protein